MKVQTESSGFVRDTQSGLVVNTNKSAFEQIKENRQREKEVRDLRREVDLLKQQVKELRELILSK
ncbi:MAG: hypothetical protein P4L79_09825 [Legionella sp.]|uniref:hypothetical protein n=1 Tax=Legionella sp. TaxID=459 RepID=UPI002849E641|nr:hypothetical protein [Legionella sp.]